MLLSNFMLSPEVQFWYWGTALSRSLSLYDDTTGRRVLLKASWLHRMTVSKRPDAYNSMQRFTTKTVYGQTQKCTIPIYKNVNMMCILICRSWNIYKCACLSQIPKIHLDQCHTLFMFELSFFSSLVCQICQMQNAMNLDFF